MASQLLTTPVGDDAGNARGNLLDILERRGQHQYTASLCASCLDYVCGVVVETGLPLAIIAKRRRDVSIGQREGHGAEVLNVDPAVILVVEGLGPNKASEGLEV